MNYKLGRNVSRHDYRTLWLRDYLNPALLPALPETRDWTEAVTVPWGMLGNGPDNTIDPPIKNFQGAGCCVLAALAHERMGWNFNAGRSFIPNGRQVLADYSAVTGYDPEFTDENGNNPTDQGTDPITALKYARKNGICGGPAIGAFAAINTKRKAQVSYTIELFGSAFLAFVLPDAFQDLEDWVIPAGQEPTGDWMPNPMNGHMVEAPVFRPDGIEVITWGMKRFCSWSFMATYADEGYCIFSPELLNGLQTSPQGFMQPELVRDLSQIHLLAAA